MEPRSDAERTGRVARWYLWTLVVVSVITAISPMFFISWPMLLLCVPVLIRVARGKSEPAAYRWSTIVSCLVVAGPLFFGTFLGTIVWGNDASQAWFFVVISAFFTPWLVSSWLAMRSSVG